MDIWPNNQLSQRIASNAVFRSSSSRGEMRLSRQKDAPLTARGEVPAKGLPIRMKKHVFSQIRSSTSTRIIPKALDCRLVFIGVNFASVNLGYCDLCT